MRCCASGPCSAGNGDGPDLRGTEAFFRKEAARYARRFERKGVDAAQRKLLALLPPAAVADGEVLDIGCGVGQLHISLLERGARQARGIDIAPRMIDEARRIAAARGIGDRVQYQVGDFVALAPQVAAADVTTLDKVVCCYADVASIVECSVQRTRQVYGLTFPRDRLAVRLVMGAVIGLAKLWGAGFHPFLHDWQAMTERIRAHGFELVGTDRTMIWQVQVYRRRAQAAADGANASEATRGVA